MNYGSKDNQNERIPRPSHSQVSSMSRRLHRFALCFYNFSAILCMKFDKEIVSISLWKALVNFLKILSMVMLTLFVFSNDSVGSKILKQKLIEVENFSKLSKIVTASILSLLFLLTIALVILQISFRNRVRNLLNNAFQFPLRSYFLTELEKNCVFDIKVLTIVLLTKHIFHYYGVCKISLISFAYSFVFLYGSLVPIAFVSLANCFENFFVIALQDLQNEVKVVSSNSCGNQDHFTKLSRKHQKLYELSQQFNKAFGLQMTLFVCCMAVLTAFCVRCSNDRIIVDVCCHFNPIVFHQHQVIYSHGRGTF